MVHALGGCRHPGEAAAVHGLDEIDDAHVSLHGISIKNQAVGGVLLAGPGRSISVLVCRVEFLQ